MPRRTTAERLLHGDDAPRRNGRPTVDPYPPDQIGDAYEGPVEYQPFPLELLPGVTGGYVTEAAAALNCDPAYVAPHVLAVLGSLIGNRARLLLKRSWQEPPVVWAAVIGESGTIKSPAWQMAVGPLYKLQGELFQQYERDLAQYTNDLEQWKARQDDDPPPEKPKPPIRRRVVVSDTTVEKLACILEENPVGVLAARDELSGWLSGFNQYKGKGGADVSNWLEVHRAGPVLVDRKSVPGGAKPTLFIPRAAVSVCGTIQPGVFARLMTPQFRESGLTARLLLAMPPRRPKRWTDADVDPQTADAYADLLRLLHSAPTYPEPVAVPLSPDAKALWVPFHDGWNRDSSELVGDLAAAFAKLEGYAARLALIHHLVTTARDTAPAAVGEESMAAGIALARWFGKEADRVYRTLAETPGEAELAELVTFIRARGGNVTARDLMTWNRRRYPTADAADSALRLLAQSGRGRFDAPASGPRGGHPARVFRLT